MNKLIVAGVILTVLGTGSVGASLYFASQEPTMPPPSEQQVTKTREVPIQTQVPKTRDVTKQKTVVVKENVPFFKEDKAEKVMFGIQIEKGTEQWAYIEYAFRTDDPVKFVIRQPASSRKGDRRWMIGFTGSSSAQGAMRYYDFFLEYWHEYPDAYLCYYKNFGDTECAVTEKLNVDEYVILFNPAKLVNEDMVSRFKSQKIVKTSIWFSIQEYKNGEWQGIPLKTEEAKTIPYLEVYPFDHFEMRDFPKTTTYTEIETYYVTETVMTQEQYTETVVEQGEAPKKSFAQATIFLWSGVGVLFVAFVCVLAGGRRG